MEETPRTTLRAPSRGPWILLALLVAGGLAAGVLWWRGDAPPQPPPQVVEAPPAAQPIEDPAPSAPVDPPTARGLLEAASADPLYREGLDAPDLERRWALVTDNLAEGVSPRKSLDFLAPREPFTVREAGGRTTIAPESYARYDRFGAAIASIDAAALFRAYRALHPGIKAAYRALGYPSGSLDAVTARALERLARAPLRDGDLEVVRDAGVWVFADPKLERLGPVEKHLLRMGPRNAGIVRDKAAELLALLRPTR